MPLPLFLRRLARRPRRIARFSTRAAAAKGRFNREDREKTCELPLTIRDPGPVRLSQSSGEPLYSPVPIRSLLKEANKKYLAWFNGLPAECRDKARSRRLQFVRAAVNTANLEISQRAERAILPLARARCPVDTGAMRRGMGYALTFARGSLRIQLTNEQDYAKYVVGFRGPARRTVRQAAEQLFTVGVRAIRSARIAQGG